MAGARLRPGEIAVEVVRLFVGRNFLKNRFVRRLGGWARDSLLRHKWIFVDFNFGFLLHLRAR